MRVAVIIQARTGSTRLPGKVLERIGGQPMLGRVLAQVGAARRIDCLCVATTESVEDDPLVQLAAAHGAAVFRGSEEDVLSRYVGAVEMLSAETVVRVTSDCPLYDPALLDEMLERRDRLVAETGEVDYYSNCVRRTYPRGLDTEIVPAAALRRAWGEANDPRAREHVTWHLYQHPETFRIEHHVQADGRDDAHLRWTVDTPADLEFVRQVVAALPPGPIGRDAVLELLRQRPELQAINRDVEQKPL